MRCVSMGLLRVQAGGGTPSGRTTSGDDHLTGHRGQRKDGQHRAADFILAGVGIGTLHRLRVREPRDLRGFAGRASSSAALPAGRAIPLTRMRGASARAMVCVNVQNAAFESV